MSQVSYGTITIVDTNDIESIIIEYAQNQSSSDPPESGWSTTRPTWKQNYFIWQRTRIHKSGTTADKDSFGAAVCLTGSTGATGSTGQSLSTTKTQYTHVASNVTITTSNHTSYTWTDNVPEYDSTKPVYWGRITNTYINPAKTEYIIYKDNGLTEAIANSVEANANASDALDKANESNSIATHANENAQGALSISRATQQHFWFNSTTSGSIEAGAYITDTPIDTFKNGKSGGYLLARSDGLELGRGTNKFMTLSATTLNFYRPGTTTIDATLASNGLQITNGSIVLGTTSGTAAGNVTLSNVDFTRAINGISRSNLRFAIGKNFGVKNDGTLYGTNVDISGKIIATEGQIGGWNIGTDTNKSLFYGNQVPGAASNNLVISSNSAENTIPIAGSDINKHWFLSAGTKFGVDSDGNLYANNANLSNATVEGAITATSLTIGSGSDSYNAINAMNAAGYTIEIINDITAAPNNVVINDNSTYLYPIMYHNGIKVESVDIINTQYIWYRGSDTIGIQGDSDNGGMVADYGYTYRVAYSFDDGEVGQAPSVQQVLVDPSKYITRISDIGITIHPEDTGENNYLQIDGNGITIYKNTDSVAQFGTTARIGRINNSRFLINDNSLQAYSGTDITPYFEVNSTGLSWGNNTAATTVQVNNAAQTATNFIKTDENGIKLQNSSDATDYLFIDSSKIALYRNNVEKLQLTDSLFRLGDTTDYINLDSNGIQIFKNNNQIANFGTTIQIGANNQTHSVFNTNAIEFYNASQQKTMTIENGAVSYLENGAMKGIIGNISNKYGLRIGQHFSTDDACFEVVSSIYDSASGCTTTGIVNAQSAAKTGTSREFSDANLHLEAYSDNGRKYNYIIISASTDGWNGIQSSVAISVNSDERLKKDFAKINELSNIILNITPYIYSWKDGHTNQRHFGFKAQDVKHILEETTEYANDYYLVSTDMNNYYNLSYTELIPLMVDIIQKHEKRIAELESQLEGGGN